MELDIRLKRSNKTYNEGESLTGLIVIDSKSDSKHEGITLSVDASVQMQLSSKNVGIFEAFYNSAKPITLINQFVEISKNGRLPSGRTEIPFEVLLKPKQNRILYETYHGVFITIQYLLKCELKRPMLNKDLQKSIEFFIEYNRPPTFNIPIKNLISSSAANGSKSLNFVLTPESIQNVRDKNRVPKFRIKGTIDSTICYIWEPFTGELVIEHCEQLIKSIELQLVRIETCGCAEGYACEITEIQNIQIADGNITASTIPIIIYMIFPRLFSCPTLITNNFKIEFEIKIVIILDDNHIITENIPIKIIRYSQLELQKK